MTLKRILFVGSYSPGSAPTNFTISFIKGYANMGLDVIFICRHKKGVELPEIEGVRILPVLDTFRYIGPFNIGRLNCEIQTWKLTADNFVPGVSAIQYYGCSEYTLLFIKKKYKIFTTIGEVPFADPSIPLREKIKEILRLRASKHVSGVFAQTNALKKYFEDYGVKNVCVYNTIIDPSRFSGLKKKNEGKVIAYCGKIGLYKDGVGDLIDAFSIVHKNHQDVKLKIIGDFYSDRDKNILLSKVRELRIEHDVIFTGMVMPEQMPQMLMNASVLALARPDNKQAKYGAPSKLGEYLFTGNPVVVTRVGEIDHFLVDGVSCLFSKPDNPENFAEKLSWCFDNPEKAMQIGINGYEVAQQHFTIQSQCVKCATFMESFL